MKVVLVEDDKKIASSVKRGLESEGFSVDVALDGPNGLWLATEGSYDVIVLDIILPGRNGYLVCSDLLLHLGVVAVEDLVPGAAVVG